MRSSQISSLATTCRPSLHPPPPQAPVNVVMESNQITTIHPTSFFVNVDFRLQQLNETSTLLENLTHEFVIVETPIGIHLTMTGGSMISTVTTTLTNVSRC